MFDFGELPDFNVDDNKPKEDDLDTEIREFLAAEFAAKEFEISDKIFKLGQDIKFNREGLNLVNDEINANIEARAEHDRAIINITAQMNKLIEEHQTAKRELQTKLNALRIEKSKIQANISQLTKELELELDKIRNSFAFQSKIERFNTETAGLFWREWAFPYQIEGAEYLAVAERAILGDKRGLGKSLTLLIAADMVKAKKILIVCPADVTSNFEKEVKYWAPHRTVLSLYKMPKARRDMLFISLKHLEEMTLLINYDAWRRDSRVIEHLAEIGFDTVILDEAHSIKDTSSRYFRGVRDIVMAENACPMCHGTSTFQKEVAPRHYAWQCNCGWDSRDVDHYELKDRRSVRYLWTATGTPILNRPQELFSQLNLVMPEVFEKEKDFLDMFCVQEWNGYWKWGPGGLDYLQKKIAGRYIARDRKTLIENGIEIPKQTIVPHNIEVIPEEYPQQYRIIKQLQKHAQIVLDSGRTITPMAAIELILRQRQANVWPGGIVIKDADGTPIWAVAEEVTESIKIDRAVKLIDEFTIDGDRVVVFSQFKGPLHKINDTLHELGIRSVVFDGSTPVYIRDQIKEDFDRKYCDREGYKPKWDVVLCNYKTGGVGLNFTGATQTIILDEEWNPGKNDQAYGRTDRIGQTQETAVHVLRLTDTIDKWMADLNDYKQKVVSGFEVTTDEMQQKMIEGLRDNSFLKDDE